MPKKIEVVFFWWFWVGIFCDRSFPLLLSFSSFKSMIFSLFFWCTTFHLCATIAKLYFKGNYILKERGTNQCEIFIGEKQYDSTTDSGLFTPSDTIRKVLNAAGHSFRTNASSLVVSAALCFKLVKKMIHATKKPPHKKKNYHIIVFSKESVILTYM